MNTDAATREFISAHPDGATLEEVAQWLGYTKQGIERIEKRALDKLRKVVNLKVLLGARQPSLATWFTGIYRHGIRVEGLK